MEKFTNIVEVFNTSFSIIDRTTRQKISKNVEFNTMNNQQDQNDIF